MFTLREEHRLWVFKNRVPSETDQTKWERVTGDWRQLHIQELHDLHCSPSIILRIIPRRMRWAGHAAHMGIKQNFGEEI